VLRSELLRRAVPARRREHRGFTLIELLVVIAIIALLVSILVPSLKRARDLARDAVCKANLRTWGVVLNAYMTEQGGPPSWAYDPTGVTSYKVHLYYALLVAQGYASDRGAGWESRWWKLPAEGFFQCPATRVAKAGNGALRDGVVGPAVAAATGDPNHNTQYYSNAALSNYMPPDATHYDSEPRQWELWNYGTNYGAYACRRHYRALEMRQHDRVILAMDATSWRWHHWHALGNLEVFGYTGDHPILLRHQGHFNAAFWDGHADAVYEGDWLYNGNDASQRQRMRADGFPVLLAPHGLVRSDRSLSHIDPSEYP